MSQPERSRAISRSDVPFAIVAIASGLLVLYLGRSLTFWYDEWDFITFSDSPRDFFRPYAEHWSTIPLLLYRGTFHAVHLHSYLPYLAEVIALHLGAVTGAYALLRTRLGSFLATILCVPLLLLGAGSENLFWAFQIGIVGSVTLGVWALVLLERPGRRGAWAASLLLLGSVMCSGMGLFFVVAALFRTVLDPELRRCAMAVVPSVLAYVAWQISFGDEAFGGQAFGAQAVDRAGLDELPAVLDFAIRGIGHAAEAMLALEGLPTRETLGLFLVCMLFVAGIWAAYRGRRRSLAVACVLALISMYVVIGLVRANLEMDHWDRSRYVYVAAFFLVLALGDLLSRPSADRVPGASSKAISFSIVVLAAWALVANFDALDRYRALHQHRTDVTRAFIALAVDRDVALWADPAARIENMPPVQELREIVDRDGSPLEDRIVSSVVKVPSPEAREQAMLAIVGDGFRVEASTGSGPPVSIEPADARGLSVSRTSGCIGLRDIEDDAQVRLDVPAGARLRVESTTPLSGAVGLGYRLEPSRWLGLSLDGRFPADVVVPAGPASWKIGLSFPGAAADVLLCALSP